MPDFEYTPRTTNDKSTLTETWHPAFLVAIQDEPTPESWQMYAKSPRMWRWQFAVFNDAATLLQTAPERQSTVTSQKFSPGGGQAQAAKAYVFTCKLLGRQIQPGERVNLDPLMPLPCEVLVNRRDKLGQMIEYANITDLRPWPDGQQYVTDAMKQALAALGQDQPPRQQAPPVQPAYQPPSQATRPPALAAWGQPATALPPAGTFGQKPGN
jgi:hypothetical protein